MQVSVDGVLCENNGICAGLAPTVFELSDDDELHVLQAAPPEELRSAVELAARRCPRQAIRVSG